MSEKDREIELNAVIMCGGSGTRFWPASRRSKPKQFLRLGGEESLIQQTVRRLEGLVPLDRIFLLAAHEHRELLAEHLPEVPLSNFIIEPAARNTAPALALAARVLGARSPEAIMAALPADHNVADPDGFQRCLVRAAEAAAEEGVIATIGIEPEWPEIGYGYIEIGEEISDGVRAVQCFVEKPELDLAQEYLSGGMHLWNAGIFVMRADTLEAEFKRLQPQLWETVWRKLPAPGSEGFPKGLLLLYPGLEKSSIDYAVMENAGRVVCVPGSFGWNDLGSWKALEKLWKADEAGNSTDRIFYSIDSNGNIISGGGKDVALIGIENLVVVSRGDVVLVCDKERCQDVRELITLLESEGREDLL
ncbi:MAG TPA: sugar phosphate nucleotidyltransferase [Acidobacteriota bacterium]|nr:sugar phosphate nucleotidyltransferase [Acidobacteriota bacterium]